MFGSKAASMVHILAVGVVEVGRGKNAADLKETDGKPSDVTDDRRLNCMSIETGFKSE